MSLPEDKFYNLIIAFDYGNFTVVTGDVLSEYKHVKMILYLF